MKCKLAILGGIFFIVIQFSTVYLYNQMYIISEKHGIPTEILGKYQLTIMKFILCSFVGFGILLAILIGVLIRNSWQFKDKVVLAEHGSL